MDVNISHTLWYDQYFGTTSILTEFIPVPRTIMFIAWTGRNVSWHSVFRGNVARIGYDHYYDSHTSSRGESPSDVYREGKSPPSHTTHATGNVMYACKIICKNMCDSIGR